MTSTVGRDEQTDPFMNPLTCFKAYDIRGRVPDELNEQIATRIGAAFVGFTGAGSVVVGRDVRKSSPSMTKAVSQGIREAGSDVLDIGLCGTEEVYFATSHLNAGGGIMITASHNPADFNGMKFVREESRPISGDSGLFDIRRLAEGPQQVSRKKGWRREIHDRSDYIDHLLTYLGGRTLTPLKIVVNSGNGCAGPVVDRLADHLPFEFVRVHHEPDGEFPNGIPNPLLPENRASTSSAVREHGADLGIAWDGDFDRCFVFDERGEFIEGYYIVGLLAQALLRDHPGARIIHDPRLTWNTQELVSDAGGIPIQSKTGHAFIKERMRLENALYGGEMSAHHYFRDFSYCDSGMIPWLLITSLLSESGRPLSDLVARRMERFPASGEINRTIEDPLRVMERVEQHYSSSCQAIDRTDGLSMDMGQWRFNLRCSNTEPVVRLNVESRGDRALMESSTSQILGMLDE